VNECKPLANGSEFSFRSLVPAVAARAGVRCIAFDRPPYGLSSRPTAGAGGGRGLHSSPSQLNPSRF